MLAVLAWSTCLGKCTFKRLHSLVTKHLVNYVKHYSYTPPGDQPMGEQEIKVRGVIVCNGTPRARCVSRAIMGGTGASIIFAGMNLICSMLLYFYCLKLFKEEQNYFVWG